MLAPPLTKEEMQLLPLLHCSGTYAGLFPDTLENFTYLQFTHNGGFDGPLSLKPGPAPWNQHLTGFLQMKNTSLSTVSL